MFHAWWIKKHFKYRISLRTVCLLSMKSKIFLVNCKGEPVKPGIVKVLQTTDAALSFFVNLTFSI